MTFPAIVLAANVRFFSVAHKDFMDEQAGPSVEGNVNRVEISGGLLLL